MKVFLSHASKDKEIALELSRLIEDCCDYATVFCSSDEGAIRVGKMFVDEIYQNLDESDIFIPLLTPDYYRSRFCMIELGTAIGYLFQKYDKDGGEFIHPFCVYPISPGDALSGTPISMMQAADLCDHSQVHQLLRDVLKTNKSINAKVENFIHNITSYIVRSSDLLKNASRIFSCASGDKVFVKEWSDFSKSSVSILDNQITTTFNLNPYERKKVIKPDFVSTVMQYVDYIDLYKYINVRPNAEFKFTVNNFTNSIKGINVEFKSGESKATLFSPVRFDIQKGKNEYSFALDKYKCDKLKQISEICFVTEKNSFVENEGTIIIENIRIE